MGSADGNPLDVKPLRVMDRKNGMVCKKTAWYGAVAAIVFLMIFGGCGKESPRETKDQATLEGVVLQYWNHRLVQRDYQAAYDRELDHASMSFDDYRKLVSRNENFAFSSLTAENVTLENDNGIVQIGLKCKMPSLPQPLGRTFKDEWIYQSGQWKHRFSETQP